MIVWHLCSLNVKIFRTVCSGPCGRHRYCNRRFWGIERRIGMLCEFWFPGEFRLYLMLSCCRGRGACSPWSNSCFFDTLLWWCSVVCILGCSTIFVDQNRRHLARPVYHSSRNAPIGCKLEIRRPSIVFFVPDQGMQISFPPTEISSLHQRHIPVHAVFCIDNC